MNYNSYEQKQLALELQDLSPRTVLVKDILGLTGPIMVNGLRIDSKVDVKIQKTGEVYEVVEVDYDEIIVMTELDEEIRLKLIPETFLHAFLTAIENVAKGHARWIPDTRWNF